MKNEFEKQIIYINPKFLIDNLLGIVNVNKTEKNKVVSFDIIAEAKKEFPKKHKYYNKGIITEYTGNVYNIYEIEAWFLKWFGD